jgi:hypothetical protein
VFMFATRRETNENEEQQHVRTSSRILSTRKRQNKERIIDALDPVEASHFIGFRALYVFLLLSFSLSCSTLVITDRNEVTLHNVSRHTRRRYECIASNGYPPDVARSFQLTIQYAPELTLIVVSTNNEELASPLVHVEHRSKEIRLKCRIVMNPIDRIHWMRDETILINNHRIHQYVSTYMENYSIAELVVKDFTYDDQGEYTCVASNLLGTNSKSVQLLTRTTTTITSTTTAISVHSSSSHTMNARRKRPKHTRTSTLSHQDAYHSTEVLREMTISSSHGKR